MGMNSPAVPAGLALGESDVVRRRGLRRMRTIATSLLVVAAVLFFLTRDRHGWWGFVNAGAEAAMVGALADWFAVTALFRHPLGLPIPHTAIIPRKKDTLGESLQEFVTDNFLREDVVRERIAAADVARRAGEWLSTRDHGRRIVDEGARIGCDLLRRIEHDDVGAVIRHMIIPRLVEEPISAAVGELVTEIVDAGAHAGLVDLGLDELDRWLEDHPERITQVIKDRAPSWSPEWANNLVADKIHREARRWVQDIRQNPQDRARLSLDHWLRELGQDLQHDPQTMERAERLKTRLLTQPQSTETAIKLWDAFRVALIEALADSDGLLRQRLVKEVEALAERLQHDADVAARVNGWAADAAGYAISRYGSEVATVISATVEHWDGKETAEKIELHVGRDLQFIRINGTVVGGLAGIVIHALAVLL